MARKLPKRSGTHRHDWKVVRRIRAIYNEKDEQVGWYSEFSCECGASMNANESW